MRSRIGNAALAGVCLAMLAPAASFARGQSSASPAPEPEVTDEIVVTATRRSANILDVPVAVSTYNAKALERAGLNDVKRLQTLSPSLNVTTTQGDSQGAVIRVRGIGTSGSNPGLESATGVSIDGVFRSRSNVALGDLLGIERIELLRGPQGTLFSKNTTAGVLNIITRRPSFTPEFEGSATFGNYDLQQFTASASGPLIADTLAARIDALYPCLLQYLSFLKSRDPILGSKVFRCLQQPSPENRLESVRFAFLAFYSMDSEKAASNRGAALQRALKYSRQAAEVNPKEAYAQFALSRTYFINNDCGFGRRYTQLAVAANPYDPIILAILGNFNSLCGYEEGVDMLDKAYQYRIDGESTARLSLILAAIRSDDLDRLPSLKDGAANHEGDRLAYHYLCETLIAAALGDARTARRDWEQFVAASPQPRNSPDDMLRQVILANVVHAKVIAFLTAKGVIVEP